MTVIKRNRTRTRCAGDIVGLPGVPAGQEKLILLDIRPGEPINDIALAAELGVGRTPVREALKRLETVI